ncbi:MAG: 1,4-alpha-glucan branching enzyme, partial [Candidatus Rokubacteria bacterium]|nr:1,4-alpha-glucan branching enzyme [Candidatus Rokubacteria bacterium]
VPEDGNRFLTYREIADKLAEYVRRMGFTHVEFMPVMEHLFYGSWGYQVTGFFAPTARYGTPQDFMYLVDYLHQQGIGVILDWVPSHFPKDQHGIGVILDWVPAHFPRDPHGLGWFDGTHLYEHADPRLREHPDWGTLVFNYGRHEVANYLIGNALFWLERYHLDGLRLDAVASMLYLDYSRQPGAWVPNRFGGRENLEAVAFLRRLNEVIYERCPGRMTIAEESTAWPLVSRPTYLGGLGFGLKWNMGWMHDLLEYMRHDPVHRKYHHNNLTFGLLYAWHENFILPLSHDEVVHGKGSLHQKMPGDDWRKFANLRAFYGFMYGHPGKKLLFMGSEFGQTWEWSHDGSLDWHLLGEGPYHRGLLRLVADLNRLYRSEPALYQVDFEPAGFQWIDPNDSQQSAVSFVRRAKDPADFVLFVSNFTPVPRHGYRVGAPVPGFYRELLNTDSAAYGGGNLGNGGGVWAEPLPWQGHPWSLTLTLPPLATLVLKPARG